MRLGGRFHYNDDGLEWDYLLLRLVHYQLEGITSQPLL